MFPNPYRLLAARADLFSSLHAAVAFLFLLDSVDCLPLCSYYVHTGLQSSCWLTLDAIYEVLALKFDRLRRVAEGLCPGVGSRPACPCPSEYVRSTSSNLPHVAFMVSDYEAG